MVSSVKLSTYGSRFFPFSGPTVWNKLPDSLRNPSLSVDIFNRDLITFLFAHYWLTTLLQRCGNSSCLRAIQMHCWLIDWLIKVRPKLIMKIRLSWDQSSFHGLTLQQRRTKCVWFVAVRHSALALSLALRPTFIGLGLYAQSTRLVAWWLQAWLWHVIFFKRLSINFPQKSLNGFRMLHMSSKGIRWHADILFHISQWFAVRPWLHLK